MGALTYIIPKPEVSFLAHLFIISHLRNNLPNPAVITFP
jgi:hypothetical protein